VAARNINDTLMALIVGSGGSLRLAGVWSNAVGFVLVRFAGFWLQSP
jgi:hypothetical protein